MIRLLFVLFCFLAFSQQEKRIGSEKEEGLKKIATIPLVSLEEASFSNEEVSRRLIGNDFLIVNGPGIYFNILILKATIFLR